MIFSRSLRPNWAGRDVDCQVRIGVRECAATGHGCRIARPEHRTRGVATEMVKIGPIPGVVLGTGLLFGLLGIPGCSDQGATPTQNPTPGAKRDELQKSTQSGIPGKNPGGAKGKGH